MNGDGSKELTDYASLTMLFTDDENGKALAQ